MVSVIVPVYNVKDYLRSCLEHLVKQSLKDIEIIVVDDGSTDGSSSIIDEYALRYKNIITIHKKNGGTMSAWTAGVHISRGEYIGFIDGDDYPSIDMYEKLYKLALKNNADIVMCEYMVNGVKNINHNLEEKLYSGDELNERIHKHSLPSLTTYSISMSRMTKLFRRNIIFDNLKYTESLSRTLEDRYITPAALLSAKSVYYTTDAYYNYSIREGSNSGMPKKNFIEDIHRAYNVQYQMIQNIRPDLLFLWEEVYLDFIRLFVFRNILRVKSFKEKYQSAKELMHDPLTQKRMKQYGHLPQGLMYKALRVSFKLHSPLLLAMLGCLKDGKR